MKRKRHSEEQIIAILKEHEAGVKTAEICCLLRFTIWPFLIGQTPIPFGLVQVGNVNTNPDIRRRVDIDLMGLCSKLE